MWVCSQVSKQKKTFCFRWKTWSIVAVKTRRYTCILIMAITIWYLNMKIYFRDIFEIWIQNNENVQEFYGIIAYLYLLYWYSNLPASNFYFDDINANYQWLLIMNKQRAAGSWYAIFAGAWTCHRHIKMLNDISFKELFLISVTKF